MFVKNKSGLCYCKKSFLLVEEGISLFLFNEGKYYEFNFEDSMRENVVWVTYENGEAGWQGYRFYINEPMWALPSFYMFFDPVDRKYKLNKLNNLMLEKLNFYGFSNI
jgi:hypothetical protein